MLNIFPNFSPGCGLVENYYRRFGFYIVFLKVERDICNYEIDTFTFATNNGNRELISFNKNIKERIIAQASKIQFIFLFIRLIIMNIALNGKV